MVLRVLEQMM